MSETTTSVPLQAVTLEYRVSGSLDGVTPAPPVVLPPGVAADDEDCRAIVVEVENLGLIDLTGFGQNGAYGDRFIRPLLILGPNVPTSGDNVAIALDGETSQVEITIPAGANGIYVESCIYVPQGHQLQLQGMSGSPTTDDPIVVRIGLFLADTVAAAASMREACCCLAAARNAAGEPANITALYDDCTLSLSAVAPDSISRSLGSQSVTIAGTGFIEGTVVAVVAVDQTDLIPVLQVTVVTPIQLQVLLDVGSADLGFYDIMVAYELAQGICSATLSSAIEITA